ncbi:PREDICTED: IQ domain-containing protein F2 [Chrysochloris asiatica]|uniref:IQ domain-containing protein F2 n=1 Tax=Chrysochloris asiatica TaxID=185453 RepID=A0A9B0X0D0_CHRAS|nr:PREDICTED: IQ domain-containing protein F2 [Chrysochloris asiatica]
MHQRIPLAEEDFNNQLNRMTRFVVTNHTPSPPTPNGIMNKVAMAKVPRKGYKESSSIKIQAWWRGTLVRRTLLHAALRAWVIQCWWRQMLEKQLERKQKAVLITYVKKEWAVVKLQSLIRMWRIHWRYCQVLNAINVIQCHWKYHTCQTCAVLRGHCVVTTTHLQFRIEIINP